MRFHKVEHVIPSGSLQSILVIMLILFCTTCSSQEIISPPWDWSAERSVGIVYSVLANGSAEHFVVTGSPGTVVGIAPGAGYGLPVDDYALQRGVYPIVVKYEVDFGDGGGWQDVTEAQLTYDYVLYDGMDPQHCTQHTYNDPGSYVIDARATYWDGEVLYASGSGESILVMITEPAS